MKLHTRPKHGLGHRGDTAPPDATRGDVTRRDAPVTDVPATRTAEPAVWSHTPHTSTWAVIALITGVLATAAALTGVLAVPAVILGVITIVIALIGLAASGKIHVTGRGVALLGLLFGIAGVVVGALAIFGVVPWWDTSNHVAWLNDWLDARAPWLSTGTG